MKRSGHRHTPLLFLAFGLAGALGTHCATPRKTTRPSTIAGELNQHVLPVRRVVLFQNGVAYFERRGEFVGDELVLKVRPSQIQDILKSITVVDFSGGQANSMALPVDLSSDKALAELPRQALGQGSLVDILRALRGAPVFLDTEDGSVEGRLVGIDSDAKDKQQRISVMDESGTIHMLEFEEVKALRILDTTLAKGLVKGLDISLGKEAWRSVDMKIFLNKGAKKKHKLMITWSLCVTRLPS